jgi:hypothetical protein
VNASQGATEPDFPRRDRWQWGFKKAQSDRCPTAPPCWRGVACSRHGREVREWGDVPVGHLPPGYSRTGAARERQAGGPAASSAPWGLARWFMAVDPIPLGGGALKRPKVIAARLPPLLAWCGLLPTWPGGAGVGGCPRPWATCHLATRGQGQLVRDRRVGRLPVRRLGGSRGGSWRLIPSHWVVGAVDPPPVAPGITRNTSR